LERIYILSELDIVNDTSHIYEGESIIVRPVCFIFRKTRAVDKTGESEGVRSRLYRGCSTTSKFSFLTHS